MMHGHLERPPISLRQSVMPDLDRAIDAAILRALAKDPQERFSGMEAFSEAVGAVAIERQAPEIIRKHLLPRAPPPQRPTVINQMPPINRGVRRPSGSIKPANRSRRFAARYWPAAVLGVVLASAAGDVVYLAFGPGNGTEQVTDVTAPVPEPPPMTAAQSTVVTPPPSLQPSRDTAAPRALMASPTMHLTTTPTTTTPTTTATPPDTAPTGPSFFVTTQSEPTQIAANQAGPSPTEQASSSPYGSMPIDQVIRNVGSSQAALLEAKRRLAAGHVEDADLLMVEAAKKFNDPRLIVEDAHLYDPNQPDRPFGLQVDRRRAALLYRDAVRMGDTAAERDRDALRALLQRQADSDDAEAKIILNAYWR